MPVKSRNNENLQFLMKNLQNEHEVPFSKLIVEPFLVGSIPQTEI